jgi:SagB-type dehydrogenase family enzyme
MAAILRRHIAFGPRTEAPAESLAELFHENTKLHATPGSSLALTPPPGFKPDELRAMARAYKRYRRHPQIALPDVANLPASDAAFDAVVAKRRSGRRFADADIALPELAKILHQSYGVTGSASLPGGDRQFFRPVPSGGALYPAEVYLGVRGVSGLEPGLYHYNVPDHSLELLTPGDPTDKLFNVCCWQEHPREAAVTIFLAGVMQRTKRKYGERGYRYVLLEVGHLAQNLCLASTALGLSVFTSCGFFDDAANDLFRLDGVDETVLYVAYLGPTGVPNMDATLSPVGVEAV